MAFRDPEQAKEYRRQYYVKNKDKLKVYCAGWYLKRKEKHAELGVVYYEQNKERLNAHRRAKYLENKEKVALKHAEWRANNLEYARMLSREWGKQNPEKAKARYKKHYVDNPAYYAEKANRRRGKIRHADFLSPEDRVKVAEMYAFCQRNPEYHVDHIIPLNGKTVSGLHVLSNLQILLKKENLAKGNKLLQEYVNG